jgi:hypothetical protein
MTPEVPKQTVFSRNISERGVVFPWVNWRENNAWVVFMPKHPSYRDAVFFLVVSFVLKPSQPVGCGWGNYVYGPTSYTYANHATFTCVHEYDIPNSHISHVAWIIESTKIT